MAKNITELKLNEVQNVTGGYGVVAQSSLAQPQLPPSRRCRRAGRPGPSRPAKVDLVSPEAKPAVLTAGFFLLVTCPGSSRLAVDSGCSR